jgi:hypothetical protein
MRRLVPIAAFALFLAVPVWAQHGGGHGSGGHAGGGGHAGFSGGGHFSGGMRSAPASRGFSQGHSLSQRGFAHQSFRNNGLRSAPGTRLQSNLRNNRFRSRNGFRTFGLRNNCVGLPCRGYGYGYGGYYDPYWWSDSSSYDDSYDRDRAVANDMNAQSLDEQRMLRQEEADGDQDSYAGSGQRGRPAASDSGVSPIAPPTVLVFRDQHKQEIRNYAIVGQTLWNFSPQRTEKIPIADLDLTATTKANDDRGLSFRVPDSTQAQ